MNRRESFRRSLAAGLAAILGSMPTILEGGPVLEPPPPFRFTWVLRDGEMVLVRMRELTKGDIFLMKETSGEVVGGCYYKATSEPYIHANGSWCIDGDYHEDYAA